MTCCGSPMRSRRSGSGSSNRPVLFEYQGSTPLTLFGRITGIRYHFPGSGARVFIDPRDRAVFDVMIGLKVVVE
jgi:hypothetical protein